VFARPTRFGDIGNTPRNSLRMPSIFNNDMALFKNIPMGESRALQLRWEVYNVFNHTNFRDIDAGLVFDAAGNQTNTRFGAPTRRSHAACDAGGDQVQFLATKAQNVKKN
jgi:hypothetical protein